MGIFGLTIAGLLVGSGLGVGMKMGDFIGKKITNKMEDLSLSMKTETRVIEVAKKKKSPSEKKD